MAVVETTQRLVRAAPRDEPGPIAPWSRVDSVWAVSWLVITLAARGLLAARIEGMLDHDQGVVGLMALDIAEGNRWPIFFDGQRYMGALEAYTAAVLVRLFGHSPAVIALAPTLYFGLFVAGQYVLWRQWKGRASGHLAALFTAVGSPMLALWGIAPRGGYSEILAWSIPVLLTYRVVARQTWGPSPFKGQAAWGFLLALGFFLNPLALIVYMTLGLDWVFGCHGADLRNERNLRSCWLASPFAPAVWAMLAGMVILALAAACHVELEGAWGRTRFVFFFDRLPASIAAPIGIAGVGLIAGMVAWWTGALRRLSNLLMSQIGFSLGAVGALLPFLIYNLRVMFGFAPRDLSLPIWIRAPWEIGPNVRDGLYALRALVGCDPHAAAFSVVGQFLKIQPPAWPMLSGLLHAATPLVIVVVAVLVATVAWNDRLAWRSLFALQGRGPTPPTVLALTGLIVCLGLYLLQGTSPNSTSIRYLLPVWIFLPGLLAQGLLLWPRPARAVAATLLLSLWAAAQAHLWTDMNHPSSVRPVAEELERRGVKGFVASTHLILMVADLTRARVAGLEYHSYWPRLHDRYANRFEPGQPIVCVNDLEYGRPPIEDLGLRLRELSGRHPGRVRRLWRQGQYEIWEADVPISEIMAKADLPASEPARASPPG
jgi:hypothetical protein